MFFAISGLLYLVDLISLYLEDRVIMVPGEEGAERMRVLAGVPLGSALGPAL